MSQGFAFDLPIWYTMVCGTVFYTPYGVLQLIIILSAGAIIGMMQAYSSVSGR